MKQELNSINLLDVQKQVVQELLDTRRRENVILTDIEYEQQKEELFKRLEAAPILEVRKQSGVTSSQLFNESFEELSQDLRIVFAQINKVDETINKHQRLNQSILNNIQLRIKKVEDELTKYERLADVYNSEQLYLETFIDSNSFESSDTYYADRNGTVLPNDYRAKLDFEREAIKLPTIISQNTLIGPSGVRLGRVEIKKQLGADLIRIKNPENTIEKAIDNSFETYWAESILVNAPMRVQMGRAYYDVDFGAVVELEVQFDYLTQLNEIGLSMFGEYPLDVVGVKYFETDSLLETGKDLIYPNAPTSAMRDRVIKDATSFQFPDIYAKRLRLILCQRHYIKTDFIASRKNQKQMELWFKTRQQADEKKQNRLFEPVFLDREENETWKLFTESIQGVEKDLDVILGGFEEEKTQAVTKYEYAYGLYNLSIRRNEYQTVGIYVSKEIPADGNIRAFSLETSEEHPEVVNLTRFTDVEYYVNDGDKWYPILPANAEKVLCERLLPQYNSASGVYESTLRFTVDSGLIIRKNGLDITSSVTLGADHVTVSLSDYDASSIYTAEYVPTEDARTLDFVREYTQGTEVVPRKKLDEFKGDGRGSFVLSYHPFVDKEKLNKQPLDYNPTYLENEITDGKYLPIKVKLVDANGYHIEQPMDKDETGIRIENVTDYFNSDVSHLRPYNEEQNIYYQYQVSGNVVQFNKPIPEGTKVIIEYPYLVGDVRVKAILRRNAQGMYGLTPVLNEYVGRFKTLR